MDSKNAYYIYKNRNDSDYFINVIIISFFFNIKLNFYENKLQQENTFPKSN